jgi:hypothetical protein
LAALAAPVAAASGNPMLALANELGTPKLGYSTHDANRSHSMFEFIPTGETVDRWTKMFTVVAASVAVDRTASETAAMIARIRGLLAKRHATFDAYDVRKAAPPVAYFKYVIDGEIDAGVIFSPAPGIVTVQQVAAHRAGVITAGDVKRIKSLVGYPS